MGLYIQKDDRRSELQEKIAADLREKAARTQNAQGERRDGVDDSAYIKNTKKTTSLAWAWILIGIFVLGAIGVIIARAFAS